MKLPQPEEFSDAEKDEWIKNQVEFLMSEYDPNSVSSITEALTMQSDEDRVKLMELGLKSYFMDSEEDYFNFVSFQREVSFKYWKEIAEVKADKSFSERD